MGGALKVVARQEVAAQMGDLVRETMDLMAVEAVRVAVVAKAGAVGLHSSQMTAPSQDQVAPTKAVELLHTADEHDRTHLGIGGTYCSR
jgi:hypothetical protein